MRAIGAGDRRVARARAAVLGSAGDHHEHALHVLRQQRGAQGDVLPAGVVGRFVAAEAGAGAGQHAAEVIEIGHGGAESLDAAADDEFLVEYADGAEAGVGLGQHRAQHALDAGPALGELLLADLRGRRLGPELERGGLRRDQLVEQLGLRLALRTRGGLGRRRRQDDGAGVLERGLRQRRQPRRRVARLGLGRADAQAERPA